MNQVKASILTIGSEILYGQTLDTNSHFISNLLSESGINVNLKISVNDTYEDITGAFRICEKNADIIIITGGLGPTNDDMTKKCLADFFNTTIEKHEGAHKDVSDYFQKRGIEFSPLNQLQAYLPLGSIPVKNEMGTAPGIWMEKEEKVFIAMPGVPHEMRHMFENFVIPSLIKKYKTEVVYHKSIMTAGIGESWLSEKIAAWEKALPGNIALAYLPGYGQVKLRLTGKGEDLNEIRAAVQHQVDALYSIIGNYIFGEDNIKLEDHIGQILRNRNLTISTAESCTGGYISHLLTSISGSSDYYQGSIIAYSNEVKVDVLGVSIDTIERHGAVSEEVVREMANGIRTHLKTDIGIATSGISGPGGGSEEKPVGMIWIAIADKSGILTKKYIIPKDRISHIKYSSMAALILLWQRLSEIN